MLIGPPAVGKMAVGRELERLTGLPLLHNHMTIELALPFFDFGTPAFNRLVGTFRSRIVEEVAASDGPGLVFTFVWVFDVPRDEEYVKAMIDPFVSRGGRVVYAELTADLETRLRRNASPSRLREKPSKRDVESSNARLVEAGHRHRMNSDGNFPFEDHIVLDSGALSETEAAERIIAAFGLPVVGNPPRTRVEPDMPWPLTR
jgi:hypothetical protein